MVVSNNNREKVFHHVLGFMKDGDDGSGEICKTLRRNGITDIMGIFTLTKQEIEDLEYKENNRNFQLNRGQRNMICTISALNTRHKREGTPLKIMDWLKITKGDFDNFRITYNPYEYFVITPDHHTGGDESSLEDLSDDDDSSFYDEDDTSVLTCGSYISNNFHPTTIDLTVINAELDRDV